MPQRSRPGAPSRPVLLLLAALLVAPAGLPLAAAKAPLEDALDALLPDVDAPERLPWTDPGRLVVGLDGDATLRASAIPPVAERFGGDLVRVDARLGFAVVTVPDDLSTSATVALRGVEGVKYVKPDAIVRASFVPSDARYAEQWGAPAIGMEAAWDATLGSNNVTVAVVDTGVAYDHPDLVDNACVNGPDYANGDADSDDDHGHGTHVAGTVAASIDNALGVAGMANACIMGVKVLDAGGSGWFSDTASGIVWAADNGADIISMSLGGCPGCDPGSPMPEAMQYAANAGVLIVAAAGNAWCSPVSYPAAYPEAIAVAALQAPGDTTASFSSCGEKVELSAPGDNVLSTSLSNGEPLSDPSGYMYLSGTSMATPHVSGVAALVWAAHPTLTTSELRCLLAQTADDVMAAGKDPSTGYGRIDAAAALATGACSPLPPSAVALTALPGDGEVDLSWTTPVSWGSDVTEFRVYAATNGSSLTLHSVIPGPAVGTTVTGLTNGVAYDFAVAAVNAMGEAPLSNVATATPTAPIAIPYAIDFESGAPSWTATGLWHLGTDRSSSPGTSYYYGIENGPGTDDNTYQTGSPNSGDIVSPPFDLRNETVAALSFWQWWEGEGGPWERPIVQVSTNGPGGPWTTVHSRTEQTGTGTFHADLNPFLGNVVHVRFHWDTIDGIANSYEGWYVDDVAVTPTQAPINTPPQVLITSPSWGSAVSGTILVEGTAGDVDANDSVEHVRLYVDGTWVIIADGTTNWSVLLDTTQWTDGWHTLQAAAWDGEDVTFDQVSVNFTNGNAPNQPPFVVITTPSPDANVSGVILVAGDAGDPDANDSVETLTVALDGNVIHNQTGGGSWSTTLDTTLHPDGWHVLTATASDGESGSTYMIGVYFENGVAPNEPPYVDIDTPTYGQTLSGAFNVAGNWSDANGDAVTLQLGLDGTLLAESPLMGAETYSFTLDTADHAAGWHTLCVMASDGQGGSGWCVSVEFVETTNAAPTVTILEPLAGDVVDGLVRIAGEAADADGAAVLVQVRVDGGAWMDAGGTSSWVAMWDTTTTWDGLHVVEARAFDGESFSGVATVQVKVDNPHAPTVQVMYPYPGATASGIVNVAGFANDGDGDDLTVQVRIDGGEWLRTSDNPYWERLVDTHALSEGLHELEARAFDGELYSEVVYVQFSVSNVAGPGVIIETPTWGDTVGGVLAVSGVATGAVQRVEVQVGYGGAWVPADGTTAWTAKVDVRNTPDGAQVPVLARAFDGTETSYGLVYVTVMNEADLAVAGIAVVRGTVRTDAAETPGVVAEERIVRITVTNDGHRASPVTAVDLTATTRPRGGIGPERVTHLAQVLVPALPAGGSAVVEVRWDTTAYVGDVRLDAHADAWDLLHEADELDNHASAHTYVLLGGAGGASL